MNKFKDRDFREASQDSYSEGIVFFSWSEIQDICEGHWLVEPCGQAGEGALGIEDDSRSIRAGELFIAISGKLVEGHDFVIPAVEKGASAVCIEEEKLSIEQRRYLERFEIPILNVKNTMRAFHRLAHAHRNRCYHCTVIALTGSCGKTTVKNMITDMLEKVSPGRVLSSSGNTNNQFGVPRNLLRLVPGQHKYAVIEAGTSEPGEIAILGDMIKPDIAVVTNVGKAHLEFFDGVESVAREKGDLFKKLNVGGVAVIPADCAYFDLLQNKAAEHSSVTFGLDNKKADVTASYLGWQGENFLVEIHWKSKDFKKRLTWLMGGEHQAKNAAAVAAVGDVLKISGSDIVNSLATFKPSGMRMEHIYQNGIHWVNDAYNANPDSMRAGITAFCEMYNDQNKEGKQYLVLGDMKELGKCSGEEHKKLLEWVKSNYPKVVLIPVGTEMKNAAESLNIEAFNTVDEATNKLRKTLKRRDRVFLKASRSLKLESIYDIYDLKKRSNKET